MTAAHMNMLATVISWQFRVGAVVVLVASIAVLAHVLVRRAGLPASPALGRIQKLFYACVLLGAAGLGLTGLGSVIGYGEHVSGWWLLLHCTAASLFAIGLAGYAVVASPPADCCTSQKEPTEGAACCPLQRCLPAVLHWGVLAAGWLVMLAGVLPMFPWFDTGTQQVLIKTHRYAGLAFVALIGPHAATLGGRRSQG